MRVRGAAQPRGAAAPPLRQAQADAGGCALAGVDAAPLCQVQSYRARCSL